MRLKSRGLGRKELVMDFREYEVIREGKEIVVVGTIREPITWDFSIRMCEDDISGMSKLLLCGAVIRFVLGSFFVRKSKVRHHWTGELSEDIETGKDFAVDAKEKAKNRIVAYEETQAAEREAAEKAAAEETVTA